MKGYLLTTNNHTEEFMLDSFSLISEMLLQELKDKYQDDELLLSKIISMHKTLHPITWDVNQRKDKDKTLKEEWHSFICGMQTNETYDIYLQSICQVSETYDCYAPKICLFLEFTGFQDHIFRSVKVFDKETASFMVAEFNKAFDKGYLSRNKYVRVLDALFGDVKDEESELSLFIKDLEKEIESNDFEHLVYHEGDEHLNFNRMYNIFSKLNYTQIILSKEFQKYIEDNDFDNDAYSDMEELIMEYIEESESLDFLDAIAKEIKTNKEKYKHAQFDVDFIKTMKNGSNTMCITELLDLEHDDEKLTPYKSKY